MKTVELTNGNIAIPVITRTFLTRAKLAAIMADLAFHGTICLDKVSKKELMDAVRGHIKYQGVTTYPDWYEDTDDTPTLNALYSQALEYIDKFFKELNKTN